MAGGAGTDIVSVSRVARLVDRGGDAFMRRWFTPAEIAYCAGKAQPVLHLAARLAAKEAVLKALGTRWEGPIPWRSIEIHHADGVPAVRLSGPVLAAARRAGIETVRVSLSHCQEFATAVAVAD